MKIIEKIINLILNIIGLGALFFAAGAITYWSIELVIVLPLSLHDLARVTCAGVFATWRIVVLVKGGRHEREAIRNSQGHAEVRIIQPTICDGMQSAPSTDG